MKKILMTIPYFFEWLLYFFITQDKRRRYRLGKWKGMECVKISDVSKFLPGSVTEYEYNPNRKPERDYITWREFWKLKGY